MKKITLLMLFLSFTQIGLPQFVTMPLDYPNTGNYYEPDFMSIIDANNLWVGTTRVNQSGTGGYLPYSFAIRTVNGGNTWQFDSIPVPGVPWIQDVEALDSTTCYYVFTDGLVYGGSIWKTVDGGKSWVKTTTTQFTGGFADFMHIFSPDTCLAVGDPTNGYFEVQITYDGGNTWNRVPQANLPTILTGETGLADAYSSIGNTIWFGTSQGRCFKSIDRGIHWTVTMVSSSFGGWRVCFSDTLHGIFYNGGAANVYYKTNDGGTTWTQSPFITNYFLQDVSSVGGMNDGFILSAQEKLSPYGITVFSTPDFFSTLIKIDSNLASTGYIFFKNASTGWLSGRYNPNNNIFKFVSLLTSVSSKDKSIGDLEIVPNPSYAEALLKLPEGLSGSIFTLRIFSISGIMLDEQSVKASTNCIKLNAQDYTEGLYILEISNEFGSSAPCKWIVNH